MKNTLLCIEGRLVKWAMCKYKNFRGRRHKAEKMGLHFEKARAKTICSLEHDLFVLLNDKSRMKGDFHVRFREKFEVRFLLLIRLRGRELTTLSYSIFLEDILSTFIEYG